jgi:ketosteroid isomerase-like protein
VTSHQIDQTGKQAGRSADEIVAAYAAAWHRGGPEEAWAYYADDVVMRLPGRSPLAGVHEGRAAVIAALGALLARTEGSPPEVHVVDRLVSGDRVALVLRERVTREDRRLELRRTNLYCVVDGRIAEIDVYEANQYEVDAFFA